VDEAEEVVVVVDGAEQVVVDKTEGGGKEKLK
jgi:hypothetical protein